MSGLMAALLAHGSFLASRLQSIAVRSLFARTVIKGGWSEVKQFLFSTIEHQCPELTEPTAFRLSPTLLLRTIKVNPCLLVHRRPH